MFVHNIIRLLLSPFAMFTYSLVLTYYSLPCLLPIVYSLECSLGGEINRIDRTGQLFVFDRIHIVLIGSCSLRRVGVEHCFGGESFH